MCHRSTHCTVETYTVRVHIESTLYIKFAPHPAWPVFVLRGVRGNKRLYPRVILCKAKLHCNQLNCVTFSFNGCSMSWRWREGRCMCAGDGLSTRRLQEFTVVASKPPIVLRDSYLFLFWYGPLKPCQLYSYIQPACDGQKIDSNAHWTTFAHTSATSHALQGAQLKVDIEAPCCCPKSKCILCESTAPSLVALATSEGNQGRLPMPYSLWLDYFTWYLQ